MADQPSSPLPELSTPAAAPPRWAARTTFAAVAAVLVWFGLQLAPFLGEPPDLDAMISLRESILVHRGGLLALINERSDGGVHPPVLDLVSSLFFTAFGEGARAQQLIGVIIFVILAASVERLLAPWLSPHERVLAALAIAVCPAIAIAIFHVSREGLMLALIAPALVVALAPGIGARRPIALGLVLALLPLIKETGLAIALPFALHAAFTGAGPRRERLWRGALVLALPTASAVLWRILLAVLGGSPWASWVLTPHAAHGPYVIALRAMFGLESGLFLRQNVVNGLVVNFLWLPALLAFVTVALLLRRSAPHKLREAVVLLGGLALIYTWTALSFPTYTIPRYATPLTLFVLLIALAGLPLWPRLARPFVLGALLVAFALGTWAPNDPVSRAFFGTVSVGGVEIYNTPEHHRGPDRMVLNLAVLRATKQVNARIRAIYASDVAFVAGDCDAMKIGEKLYSIGLAPSAYVGALPGVRPMRCVNLRELPPDAATGAKKIGLIQTPEQRGQPPALAGPSIVNIH